MHTFNCHHTLIHDYHYCYCNWIWLFAKLHNWCVAGIDLCGRALLLLLLLPWLWLVDRSIKGNCTMNIDEATCSNAMASSEEIRETGIDQSIDSRKDQISGNSAIEIRICHENFVSLCGHRSSSLQPIFRVTECSAKNIIGVFKYLISQVNTASNPFGNNLQSQWGSPLFKHHLDSTST